jgi:hypothetical protein
LIFGSTMQIEGHHIGRCESALGQLREEQLVDDAVPFDTDPALRLPNWMGCHHHPTAHARRSDGYLGAVVKRAHEVTFRTAELLVWGQMQAEFDLRPIKQLIVFPTRNAREASQIGDDGSGAILAIQPQQRPFLRKLLRLQIGLDRCHCATQFCPKLSEALVAKGAEPLMRMHLEGGGAGTHHFPALASSVAWGAEVS